MTAEIDAALGSKHLEEQKLRDLHLLVDGVRIEPRVRGFSARFTVPAAAKAVWLVSRSTITEPTAASLDRRSVGVCLIALTIADGFGPPRAIQVDDPCLGFGFHPVEREGDATWRWTTGHARLPAKLWDGVNDTVFLRIDFARSLLPR